MPHIPGSRIEGLLEAHFETGMEGHYWSHYDPSKNRPDGLRDYPGLHPLEDGDRLTVFGDDGAVIWEGTVDLEYETGRVPYPFNPAMSQQAVLGYWVHGLQRGTDPETWARMFFEERRAVLVAKAS